MATGKALVCKLGEHTPIPGADNIVEINMFGETIITQKSNKEGDLGMLFDMETCLSQAFASANNMYRHKELNKDKDVVGYLEDDRRIRPIKLKGVKVSALWMPVTCLNFLSTDAGKHLIVGTEIDSFDGMLICEKYVSKATQNARSKNKGGVAKLNRVPTFKEHFDTDQWARNKHKIQTGDLVIVTEKLHGTSGRCGYLPSKNPMSKWKKFVLNYITCPLMFGTIGDEEYWEDYSFVVGSRRVVKSIDDNEAENKNHYYNEDLWTKISNEKFKGKLHEGETVFFEIVGYTPEGAPIMPSVSNEKLKNFLDKKEYKEFISQYGDTTHFRYGCTHEGAYRVFVYRITQTNEQGETIDYSWEQVKRRCEQLEVDHVPELSKCLIGEDHTEFENMVESLTNEASSMFPEHIREGVCIRAENGAMSPFILKNKSFVFKVLEGIVKDSNQADIEESN